MATCLLLELLFLLFLARDVVCFDKPSLTNPPISESSLLYSSATFSCEGIGDGLVWTVAHTTLNDTEQQERNIKIETVNMNSNLSSSLTIPALPINDGIEIGCVIVSVNPINAIAKEVILTVNGISPVKNIKWHPESDLLTWSPPFFYSKDIIDAFLYIIVLNDNYTFNTTSTRTHLEISNCSQFNVSITVHTDQYVSEDNDKISYGNHTIETINHTVIFDRATNVVNTSIVNLVKFSDQMCSEHVHINGTAVNIKDGHTFLYPPLKIISSDQEEIVVNYNITQLQPYSMYEIRIFLINSLNITEDQDNIIVSTFNVQDFCLSITGESNRSVMVTCMFMQGSITKSCHLVFADSARDLEESFNVTESKQTLLSLQEIGNYTVTVYDLVNESIIGPAITYSKKVELIPSSSYTISQNGVSTSMTVPTPHTPANKPSTLIIVVPGVIGAVTVVITIVIAIIAIIIIKKNKEKKSSTESNIKKSGYKKLK